MTLFIIGIISILFLVLLIAVILNIIFLIVGVFKIKRDRVASIVFICFALVNMIAMVVGGYLIFGPKKIEIKTPDGSAKIWNNVIEDYLNNVANDDFDEVEEMLEEESDLVYCCDDDGEDILQEAALNGNIEMMELAMEYGAEFDSEIVFENSPYDGSIQAFLDEIGRKAKAYDFTDDDVYEIIEFMLENEATIEFDDEDNPNALFLTDGWICYDKMISDEDIELVKMLHSYGAGYSYELYFDYVTTIASKDVKEDRNCEKLLELIDGE